MTTTTGSAKGMNIALWVAQVLLAALYLMAGANKSFQSIEALSKMLPWVTEMPAGIVRFIGISEVLGALGLLLPSLLRKQPKLTIYAAWALALLQVMAAGFHLSRGEASVIGMNSVLIALSVFIAWGRNKKAPIVAR